MSKIHLLLTVCLIFLLNINLLQAAAVRIPAPPTRLREAVECLVKTKFVQQNILPYVGLKIGNSAKVRYHIGSLVDSKENSDEYNVIIFSATNAVALIAVPNEKGGYLVAQNGYYLKRQGYKWVVEEGNGGYQDYKAVSQFITKLSRKDFYIMQLIPGGDNCT